MSRKLKYEDIKHYIEVESGSYCRLISTEYKGCKEKMDIQCGRCGEIYKAHWNHFKSNNKHQCNDCSIRMSAERYKFSIDDVRHYIEVESKSGCRLISEKYENNRSKLEIMCKCGDIFQTSLSEFKTKHKRRDPKQQCNDCSTLLRLEKKNNELPEIAKFVEENSNCKLLNKVYKGQMESMDFLCACGEIFQATLNSFIHKNKRHCDTCGIESGFMSMRLTIEEVLRYVEENSTAKLLTSRYLNDHTNMDFKCECGNIFQTTFDRFKRMDKRRCDVCSKVMSKGEVQILNYLKENNIDNQGQKSFSSLIGLGGGLLSYDFYLPNNNTLIEFQGIQHEVFYPWFHESKEDFEYQLEHDRRKREYSQKHNIKLLEIWYYDFDNIESILDQELNVS